MGNPWPNDDSEYRTGRDDSEPDTSGTAGDTTHRVGDNQFPGWFLDAEEKIKASKAKSPKGAWDDAMKAPVSWESLRKEGPHKMIEEPEDAMTDNPPEAPHDRAHHANRKADPREK